MNAEEWVRPSEFLPERFDVNSPLFLRPDGKARQPTSYLPFSSGARNCLGQTLAMCEVKVLLAFVYTQLNIEVKNTEVLQDPEAYYGFNTPYKLHAKITQK